MLSWCQSEQMDDLLSDQHENTDMQQVVVFMETEDRL